MWAVVLAMDEIEMISLQFASAGDTVGPAEPSELNLVCFVISSE
jgi:hypothetical protein